MIKILFILFFLSGSFCSFSQEKWASGKKDTILENTDFRQKDTSFWIYNLRQLRDAVYTSNKVKAKIFFNFPFKSEGNEIWYLVYSDNEKAIEKIKHPSKPFTEKDFETHFAKIFPKQLTKCFLKIKLETILKNGQAESEIIKEGNATYKLYITYDKILRTFELNLATNTLYKISDSEYEPAEANYIYRFKVLKNGHIKFQEFLMAG
jgi:hypothetical protein